MRANNERTHVIYYYVHHHHYALKTKLAFHLIPTRDYMFRCTVSSYHSCYYIWTYFTALNYKCILWYYQYYALKSCRCHRTKSSTNPYSDSHFWHFQNICRRIKFWILISSFRVMKTNFELGGKSQITFGNPAVCAHLHNTAVAKLKKGFRVPRLDVTSSPLSNVNEKQL